MRRERRSADPLRDAKRQARPKVAGPGVYRKRAVGYRRPESGSDPVAVSVRIVGYSMPSCSR